MASPSEQSHNSMMPNIFDLVHKMTPTDDTSAIN